MALIQFFLFLIDVIKNNIIFFAALHLEPDVTEVEKKNAFTL